jgi:hypothetical protein
VDQDRVTPDAGVPVSEPPRRTDRAAAERLWAAHARTVRRYLRVLGPWTKFSFFRDGREGPLELPMPSFACLAELPQLVRVELVAPTRGLVEAVRAAVPARVRVEVLSHN